MKVSFLSLLVLATVVLSCSSPRTTTTAATTDTATMTTTTDNAAMTTDTTTAAPTTDTSATTTQPTTTQPTTQPSTAGVPANITTTFNTRYPNAANVTWSPYNRVTAPIDWEMTGWPALDTGDYVAEFDLNGQRYYAWYDASGAWIGSSSMLANHGDLPKPVRDLLVSKYNGYTIEKVEQEFDSAGTKYEIKLKKGDDDEVKLHVSEAGAVLKEKKKT